MASLKTQLVRSNEVRTAIEMMLRSWAAKVTSSMGGKQVANELLTDVPTNYTMGRWDGQIPEWSGGDTGKEPVGRVNLFKGVMTIENAFKCVDEAALDAVARFEMLSRNKPSRGPLRWRKWASVGIGKRVMGRERLMVRTALQARALRKRRRVGRQRISTTRTVSLPDSGPLVFSGRKALRMPRGRPPLPADTWMARYNARKSRRQQKNATPIKRNRGSVKLPPTKSDRPDAIHVLGS
jgi:hypothetical protein